MALDPGSRLAVEATLKEELTSPLAASCPTTISVTSPTSPWVQNNGTDEIELPKRYRWRPTFWRIRPLLGMVSIAVTIISLLVSLAILEASDGVATADWYFQPTVYLAIATACSNGGLQCALALAAPISWWYKAVRGSTIKDLELDWQAGQCYPRAFLNSIRYRRMVGWLSIASLAASLVLIDGPLLQRASSVHSALVFDEIPLNLSVVTQLPAGFSLGVGLDGYQYTADAIEVYLQHTRNKPITVDSYCNGTCHTKIHGPGYALQSCWDQSWAINRTILTNPNATWGIGNPFSDEHGHAGAMSGHPLVYSTVFPTWNACDAQDGREPLLLSTGIANYDDCDGHFTFTNCTYLPAVLEYDVTLTGNVLTYQQPTEDSRVLALANDYCSNDNALATTGLLTLIYPYVTANGSLATWYGIPPGGTYPPPIPDTTTFSSFSMNYMEQSAGNNRCLMRTHDPRTDIITIMNDLLFRSGAYVGTWKNASDVTNSPFPVLQTVQAKRTRHQVVVHSDLRWFGAAAAIQLLTILLILPNFWGKSKTAYNGRNCLAHETAADYLH